MPAIIADRIQLGQSGMCPRASELPNGDDVPLLPGMPVSVTDLAMVVRATSTSAAQADVIGLVLAYTDLTLPTRTSAYGIVDLIDATWLPIVGTVGLIPNAIYFLGVMPGTLTTTPPTAEGLKLTIVGRALTTHQMQLDLTRPILL